MTARRITRGTFVAMALLLAGAIPVIAEQGWAESPGFTVNTVPEPAALIAVVGVLLLARRSTLRILCVLLALLLWTGLPLFAAQPVVTNLTAQQQAWPSFLVDIRYDVSDAAGHTQTISAAVSTNSGAQYSAGFTNFAGDIGPRIAVGTNKLITWDAGVDLPDFTSDTVRVRITADDWMPFVDITNGSVVVSYDVSCFSVSGTNNQHVVGDMWWTNECGTGVSPVSGVLPATGSWTIAAIQLAVGTNVITVCGSNLWNQQSSDSLTITRGEIGTGTPFIDITTTPMIVSYDTTDCVLAGTNNEQVVGDMWVSNAMTAIVFGFPATSSWIATAMPLAFGSNSIVVRGTNVLGKIAVDRVAIVRPGPFVDITNVVVDTNTVCATLSGTNNAQVVGDMWISNGTVGSVSLSFAGGTSWIAPAVALTTGINRIFVYGSNSFGVITNDSISFTGAKCLVIDVSGGPLASSYPVTELTWQPELNDEYKTKKILLRWIPAGSFLMGSPATELGRDSDETQHMVTLSSNFYMGVFEITQGQYSNVMGNNPAYFHQGVMAPKRPVDAVSWDRIRGGEWPGSPAGTGAPENTWFMGVLRAKTGLPFDLPTEAQWEYACRAGTTNALNNNTNLISTEEDPNMDILGRYWYNGGSIFMTHPINGAHAVVGSYIVNNWGLYDMHGNIYEWCLDWYTNSYGGDVTDPPGPASGSDRVIRGGSWAYYAMDCRSANRDYITPDYTLVYSDAGFRLTLSAGQ